MLAPMLPPLRWLAILLLCLPPALLVAPSALGEPAAIRITGSGYTMPRFLEPWAEKFREASGTEVVITGTGTSTAPPALLRGEADVAAMSRRMSETELDAFEARFGRQPVAIPVAADALAVFVNTGNPLKQLTLSQLDGIFSAQRRCGPGEAITRWGQLGVGEPFEDRRLTLYGRRPGSGTGALFRDLALCGGPYRDSLRINPGGASAALAIAEEPYGIGFGSRTDAAEGMKPVAIAREAGTPFVLPGDASDIYSGAYPLGRLLYFYVLAGEAGPPEALRSFLAFALSESAQDIVEEAGFLRIPAELAETLLSSRVRGPSPPS